MDDDIKQYFVLDDLGPIGTQDKKARAEIEKDIKRMVRHIKLLKSKKSSSTSKKAKKRLAKAK